MNVQELIDILNTVDDKKSTVYINSSYGEYGDVDKINIRIDPGYVLLSDYVPSRGY